MINSALWSFALQYGQMIITFISSIVLARLLSPEEIGVYSVSFALIGFATLFRNFGVTDYLVQEKNLTDLKLQTAFTLNNLVSWVLGIAIYLAAKPAAEFYNSAGIASVFHLLALNFIFVPLGAITLALLRREMNFKALAVINLVGILITALVSVAAAWAGQSYLSMAWGAVAGSISTALLSQKYRSSALSFRPIFTELSSIWSYSSHSIWISLARHTSTSASELFAGKFLGMNDVGLLSKGKALPTMVNQLVSGGLKPLAMPEFAKTRDKPALMSMQYFKLVNITLGTMWPILLFVFVMADHIVLLLFGEKWVPAVPVVKIATISVGLYCLVNYTDDLLKATGRIKLLSKLEPYFLSLSIGAAAIGSQFSLIVMLYLSLVAVSIRIIAYFYILDRVFSLKFYSHCILIAKNLIVALALTFILLLFRSVLIFDGPFFSLLYNGLLYMASWTIIAIVTKNHVYELLLNILLKLRS